MLWEVDALGEDVGPLDADAGALGSDLGALGAYFGAARADAGALRINLGRLASGLGAAVEATGVTWRVGSRSSGALGVWRGRKQGLVRGRGGVGRTRTDSVDPETAAEEVTESIDRSWRRPAKIKVSITILQRPFTEGGQDP